MRKTMVGLLVLFASILPMNHVQAAETEYLNKEELTEAMKLNNYNIYLRGQHSAENADVEGPMAIRKDSNFPVELDTFSYGALFEGETNTVGNELDFSKQKINLLIGGKVNNYSQKDDNLIVSSHVRDGKRVGYLVSNNLDWADQAFRHSEATGGGIFEDQKRLIPNMLDIFSNLERNLWRTKSFLETATNNLLPLVDDKGSVQRTLGDWEDGKLYDYEIYQSVEAKNILVVNIPPEDDGTAVIRNMGFDYQAIINNKNYDQIIITSYTEQNGERHHAQKVVFKGNYLTNSTGINRPLESSTPEMNEHASKIAYYFPTANQVTNFFDKKINNKIAAPRDILKNDSGLDNENHLKYSKDYLKDYATGQGSNGSATYGGGAEVVGSVYAPIASVVFSGSSINGTLVAYDLHQRNGMEVHYFPDRWIPKLPVHPTEPLGKIKLIKKDKDNGEKLAGAVFQLLDNNQELIMDNLATKKNGEISLIEVPLGKYYFKEKRAPKGYQLDETLHPVIVDVSEEAEVAEVMITNEKLPEKESGRLELIKLSSGENPQGLVGAEFKLLDSKGNIYKENLKTGRYGGLVVDDLPYGTYELIETKAPEGYELDDTPHKITISKENLESITQLIVRNELKEQHGRLKIVKEDEETNYRLANAEFKLIDDDNNTIFEKLVTDTNGELLIDGLKNGTYHLIETKAPQGYELDSTPILVEVSSQEITEKNIITITNKRKPKLGKVKLVKLAEDGETRLAGAEFQLIDSEDKVIVDNIKTNESGEWVSDDLAIGEYKLIETKAPEGYELDATPKDVVISDKDVNNVVVIKVVNKLIEPEEILGGFSLVKYDSETKETLAGAVFKVMNERGELVKEKLVTNNQGIIHADDLPLGNYQLIETQAPEGYELNETPLAFTITENSETKNIVELSFENKPEIPMTPIEPSEPIGGIKLVKKDAETGEFLPGAIFKIASDKERFIAIVTTNDEGIASIKGLPLGEYYVTEVQAPEGYELDTESKKVTVKENDQDNMVILELTNKPTIPAVPIEPATPLGAIQIVKQDKETKEKLAGAQFKVVNHETGEAVSEGLTTDDEGKAYHGGLKLGQYQIIETIAPAGYEKLTEPMNVMVTENPQENLTIATIDNEKIPEKEEKGTLKVIKQDTENQKRLAGAEFELKSANGETYTLITDENGEAVQSDLAFGTYTLTETKAPEGYEKLTEPLTVKVEKNAENNVVVLTIDNEKTPETEEKGTLKLIKQDTENQKRLAGAEFELKSANGETHTLITDKNGEAVQSDLAFGTYTLTETKAPKGYEKLTEPLAVKVEKNADDNVVVLTVDNEKTPETEEKGTLKVIKQDTENQDRLTGAEFELKSANGETYTLITDKNGEAAQSDLAFGTYMLTETKAPKGYEKLTEPLAVKVEKNADDNVVVLTVDNEKTPIKPTEPTKPIDKPDKPANKPITSTNTDKNKLPQTSESQGLTKALTVIGVIIIIGIVVFYTKKRKNSNHYKDLHF